MFNLSLSRAAHHPVRQSIFRHLAQLRSIAKQRRDLRKLEPHLLDDIGLSRQDAHREGARAVWDAPEIWRN